MDCTKANQGYRKLRWAVVGGGMLGLGVARKLLERGQDVTLFDSGDSLGGLTSAWKIGNVTWDRFYHVTLLSDAHLRRLLRELDLDEDIEWVQTKTGFYSAGKLRSLSSSIEFLKFPVLNLYQKFRLGGTIFFGSKLKNWKKLESISVESWLIQWSGKSTYEKIWKPLLQCKLGNAYQRTNAAFIWAYIQRMYAARRSGMKRELFGYVQGGYDRMLQRLAMHLAKKGLAIRCKSRVDRVFRDESEKFWTLEFQNESGRGSERFDRVVMTLPSPIILKTVNGLSNEEQQRLGATDYLGVVCTSLLLDRPLGGFYVTNITDPGIPITGVIEMGSVLKPEHLGGHYLVYLPKYVDSCDPALEESTERIHARCIATLSSMYPSFHPEQVLAIQTAKARHVMAIPTLNYSDNRCPVVSSKPGLYLLNSARIVDGTLNVNEVLRLVENEFEETIWPDHQVI